MKTTTKRAPPKECPTDTENAMRPTIFRDDIRPEFFL